ncbi:hypothetical protein IWX90DRAFT_220490 [Phyllosticta citrichinensis]|uniref:Secreted protein n=1 Tax=Phyllosticta citrichinensis TaxID=1130410 RepID=A0ABR1XU24_9PEZI
MIRHFFLWHIASVSPRFIRGRGAGPFSFDAKRAPSFLFPFLSLQHKKHGMEGLASVCVLASIGTWSFLRGTGNGKVTGNFSKAFLHGIMSETGGVAAERMLPVGSFSFVIHGRTSSVGPVSSLFHLFDFHHHTRLMMREPSLCPYIYLSLQVR